MARGVVQPPRLEVQTLLVATKEVHHAAATAVGDFGVLEHAADFIQGIGRRCGRRWRRKARIYRRHTRARCCERRVHGPEVIDDLPGESFARHVRFSGAYGQSIKGWSGGSWLCWRRERAAFIRDPAVVLRARGRCRCADGEGIHEGRRRGCVWNRRLWLGRNCWRFTKSEEVLRWLRTEWGGGCHDG